MLGAIIGDIAGSRFEFHNHRSKQFELLDDGCFITDDSILTLAVAKALLDSADDRDRLGDAAVSAMREIGRLYPDCGFGGMFFQWLFSEDPQPYSSYGNGAAMRVSPCGFFAESEAQAKALSRAVTEVTHNHPEGIRGAEATTVAVWMARNGATKTEIRERMQRDYYDLGFTLNGIRDTYEFSQTCQETVPQAIVAFLASDSFEDAIRNAISIGGDSDTLAAISGGIAEAYYGVPVRLREKALTYLDTRLRGILDRWEQALYGGKPDPKLRVITKYRGRFERKDDIRDFTVEFIGFAMTHPEYGLKNYREILARHGIEWTEPSMADADVSGLEEQAVLALILAVLRAERFSDGVLRHFIREGHIGRWLARLEQIDTTREPEVIRPIPGWFEIRLVTVPDGGERSLRLAPDLLELRSSQPGFGTSLRRFEPDAHNQSLTQLLRAADRCLASDGWADPPDGWEDGRIANRYELEAGYDDGTTVTRRGVFDRAHMPEGSFVRFIWMLREVLLRIGQGEITELRGFFAALKEREVKYCGVTFTDGGKVYHYRTVDLRIQVGDTVVVPVGEHDYEREGTVQTVEFCRWDDTPYPLEETKEILRLASDPPETPPGLFLDEETSEDKEDGDISRLPDGADA